MLTMLGAVSLGRWLETQTVPGRKPCRLVPSWDGELRELRLGLHVVKRYRQRAECQERILAAFEEKGWPALLADPLPVETGYVAAERLAQTLSNLNRAQQPQLLHFGGDGSGEGIRWKILAQFQD
jgi:hypothetical protein